MNSSKDKSSMRYFMASLKPLGNPLFWAPLGLISLMFIGWWQYQQHPEWLGTVGEQPEQSIDGTPLNIPADNSQTQINPTTTQQPSNNSNLDLTQGYDPTQILTFSSDPKKRTRSTQNNNTNTNTNPTTQTGNSENKSSLFAPLMPTIKPNTQNNNPDRSTLNPIQVESPLTRDYPLRKAIEGIPSSQPTYNNYPRSTSNPYSSNYSNQGGYNNNQLPTNNTTQQPYSNNYGQNNTTNQPDRPSYSNNNYYRPNNSLPSYQSPYSNNYNQPNNSVPQTNPYNSYNNNNSAGYQVQPRINGEAGY